MFCCIATYAVGQDESKLLSMQEGLISLPNKLLNNLENKVSRLERQLEKSRKRYMANLKRYEKKLFQEYTRKDSTGARNVFGDIDSVYAELERSSKQRVQEAGPKQQYYNGRLDSVYTTLRFLSAETLTKSGHSHKMKELNSAIGSYSRLQQRFTEDSYTEQFLIERRRLIVQKLTEAGMGKQLKVYQQQVQYYQQHLRQTRDMLSQPDKLAAHLIAYASRLPLFRSFMEKHSAFAAIFPQVDPQILMVNSGSMQTRSALQTQMGSTLGSNNPQALLQQSLGQAEAQLNSLKDKLSAGSFGDAGELPTTKTNEEKTRSFWKRLEVGGNLQSARSTSYFPTTSDLGLSVGYKLNPRSVVGVGASYKIGWGSSWQRIRVTHEGVGLRSFLDWKLKGSFWMSGGAELNHRQRIGDIGLLSNPGNWQQSALIGITRKFKVGKAKTDARLLYDFLWNQQIPRTQPLVFRVGYTFK